MRRLLCFITRHNWQKICYGFFDKCTRCGKLRAWYER